MTDLYAHVLASSDTTWRTQDEAAMLHNAAVNGRTKFLTDWLTAAERRANWDVLDGPALMAYARRLLRQVETGEGIEAPGRSA